MKDEIGEITAATRKAVLEHQVRDAINAILPEIVRQIGTRQPDAQADIALPWGRLKLSGAALILLAALVGHSYVDHSGHMAIEGKYEALVQEAQIQNYLQTLPINERPPLPMPPHLRELLMKSTGTMPTSPRR